VATKRREATTSWPGPQGGKKKACLRKHDWAFQKEKMKGGGKQPSILRVSDRKEARGGKKKGTKTTCWDVCKIHKKKKKKKRTKRKKEKEEIVDSQEH